VTETATNSCFTRRP